MSITKTFLLAGDATFTIDTPDAGHRTYRITHLEAEGKWPSRYLVKMLTGPDNQSDYTYLGKLDDFTGQVVLTPKSKLPLDSYPVRLLNRILARVWADDAEAFESKGFRLHHEGKCGRCGRKLTVPSSIESGIGPECQKKIGLARVLDEHPELFERMEEKAEFARREAEQERAAFMSDPDFDIEGYGTGRDADGRAYAYGSR